MGLKSAVLAPEEDLCQFASHLGGKIAANKNSMHD
jgi:hypothetical protein